MCYVQPNSMTDLATVPSRTLPWRAVTPTRIWITYSHPSTSFPKGALKWAQIKVCDQS